MDSSIRLYLVIMGGVVISIKTDAMQKLCFGFVLLFAERKMKVIHFWWHWTWKWNFSHCWTWTTNLWAESQFSSTLSDLGSNLLAPFDYVNVLCSGRWTHGNIFILVFTIQKSGKWYCDDRKCSQKIFCWKVVLWNTKNELCAEFLIFWCTFLFFTKSSIIYIY